MTISLAPGGSPSGVPGKSYLGQLSHIRPAHSASSPLSGPLVFHLEDSCLLFKPVAQHQGHCEASPFPRSSLGDLYLYPFVPLLIHFAWVLLFIKHLPCYGQHRVLCWESQAIKTQHPPCTHLYHSTYPTARVWTLKQLVKHVVGTH